MLHIFMYKNFYVFWDTLITISDIRIIFASHNNYDWSLSLHLQSLLSFTHISLSLQITKSLWIPRTF